MCDPLFLTQWAFFETVLEWTVYFPQEVPELGLVLSWALIGTGTFYVDDVSLIKAHSRPFKKEENKKRNLAINNLLHVRDKTHECSKKEKSFYWVLLYFCPAVPSEAALLLSNMQTSPVQTLLTISQTTGSKAISPSWPLNEHIFSKLVKPWDIKLESGSF